MISMRVSQVAEILHAERAGPDVEFTGCSTDSRTIGAGELFVALSGPRFDGHRFVAQALGKGAAAAMVERGAGPALPAVVVDDTLAGLARLARAWRERFTIPMTAITGSNGKTTVKEMLAAILSLHGGPVLATAGNLNNHIGVPLTLSRLDAGHHFGVIELGANHPGEIAALAALVGPGVAVITQCAPAHLEGFGSVEGVARAKGELIEALGECGTAVINADDPHAGLWRRLAGTRDCMSFGIQGAADVQATWRDEGDGTRLSLATPVGPMETVIHLPGRHNVMNALAGASAAIALGAERHAIEGGLARVRPIPGRLYERAAAGGVRIVDDSYNANPESLGIALEVLATYAGERWLVLGDMAELGPDAPRFHCEAGALAREHGVHRLYATGRLCRDAVHAFGRGASHFGTRDALVDALKSDLCPGVTVLVKGSLSSGMGRVVSALSAED